MESAKSAIASRMQKRDETCAEHGAYSSVSLFDGHWTGCPECEAEAKKVDIEATASDRKRLEIEAKLTDAGIPPRFQAATLDSFFVANPGQKEALETAMHYAAEFCNGMKIGRCLAFVGHPGTGKTHLAAAIIREVLAIGYTAKLTTVGDYVREIKDQCWNQKTSTESEVLVKYCQIDLLILDEVGVQFGTRTEENLVFTLINKRYDYLKPTIVISNENEDGLKNYLGARAFDRLREGGGLIVGFDWESMRGRDLKGAGRDGRANA